MSLQDLTQALKHLPGKHNQKTHGRRQHIVDVDKFAESWYHKSYAESDVRILQTEFPYTGVAYRALQIPLPDPFNSNLSDAARNLLDLHHSEAMEDYQFSGAKPSKQFRKSYEQAYTTYAKEVIDSTAKSEYSSWAKSMAGVDYYQKRSNYNVTTSGQHIQYRPEVVMRANVTGVDLQQVMQRGTNFQAAQIRGAEEILVTDYSDYDLMYNLSWN